VAARVDGRQEILGTSQGPRGGDDIYVARKGADYGWPHTSYGTAYPSEDPPDMPDVEGTMKGYDEPLFDWTPSVGLSAITQIEGPAFQRWWGRSPDRPTASLLVAGIGARWLYRVRISDGAVRGYTGFYIGARARSLAQLPNGYIVVGLDAGRELLVLHPTWVWSTPLEEKVPVGSEPAQ
jgi:glucose/arabinose dehydrogenase